MMPASVGFDSMKAEAAVIGSNQHFAWFVGLYRYAMMLQTELSVGNCLMQQMKLVLKICICLCRLLCLCALLRCCSPLLTRYARG